MKPRNSPLAAFSVLISFLALAHFCPAAEPSAAGVGMFSSQGDVGNAGKMGIADYNATADEYAISGGGENIWNTNDAFHFVWKKMSGDLTFTANIRFLDAEGDPHRKACLFVRQSLASGSAYADVAVHASGLTSLQYREVENQATHEVRSEIAAPARVRLEKRGDYFSISVAGSDGRLKLDGGYLKVPLHGDFFVGLGVCAHDDRAITRAVFSHVEITALPSPTAAPVLENTLETVNIASTDRSVVYHTRDHIEAPNWSRDGAYFVFNSGGKLFKLAVTNGTPDWIDTGVATNCNNDHGFSPDGTRLAISSHLERDKQSRVFLVPASGGAAQQMTPLGPSYWHGWSPDGQTLAYCAERNGNFDIYSMPVGGGEEVRLTTAPGLDDGPDYSPDGKYIYFNSERTGLMQIWRMNPDGSDQRQITSDENNNWFAHPSPNGRWIVFLTYEKEVKGHPGNQDVQLRLMELSTGKITVLARLFGGQGTMNVPSWSPDSSQVAFVSCQRVYP
jgi:WD40 repeat protein